MRYVALVLGLVLACNTAKAGEDALAEVNAARAARGLQPYVPDPNLTAGAINVADLRAQRLWVGHTANDFNGLPVGTVASASGVGWGPPSVGWLTCSTYEHWTYAGAAWAMGRDGNRYMVLFVR